MTKLSSQELAFQTRELKANKNNFKLGPISIDCPKGYIICILGRNGSVKTTLLNTLNGLESVESERLSYSNYNFYEHEKEVRYLIGYVQDYVKLKKTIDTFDYYQVNCKG